MPFQFEESSHDEEDDGISAEDLAPELSEPFETRDEVVELPKQYFQNDGGIIINTYESQEEMKTFSINGAFLNTIGDTFH